ncbi:hypothetical protein VTI28DRAFT_10570 [Corynascus sepedonium]
MAIQDTLNSLILAAFGSLAPYHLLFYSTLLGTELFQSFVNTKVCFVALPRSAFTTLQKRIFPIYFWAQTTLITLSALTFPPGGIASLVVRKTDGILYAVALGTAILNLMVYGPQTQRAMVDCVHQGTRDRSNVEERPVSNDLSPEMVRLRKVFSRAHAMTIHLNLVSIGAMLVYGWRLGSRLSIETQ